MPFAFGHLIPVWGIAKLLEHFKEIKLRKYEWGALLLGAVLPDIDHIFDWVFGMKIHRTITHSLMGVAILWVFGYLAAEALSIKRSRRIAWALACGVMIHILLDMTQGYPGVMLLWPSEYSFYIFGIIQGSPVFNSAGGIVKEIRFAILDMGLGTAWIFYLWFRGKLRF